MFTVNRFTVLGNVGSVTVLNGATKVSIATDRSFKDNSGKRQQRTDWVLVTIFNEKMAAWIAENVSKGHKVYVEGRISSGSYGEGDNRKFSTDLIVDKFNSLED